MSDVPPPPIPPQDPSGYSNYPRQSYGPGDPGNNPYQRPPGVYFDAIGQAWRMLQMNMGNWVLSVLVVFILYYVCAIPVNLLTMFLNGGFSGATRNPLDPSALFVSISFGTVFGCVFQVLISGLLYMGVMQARNQPIAVGNIFGGFRKAGSLIVASFLTTILIYIGFFLLIVPGIFLGGLFIFVPLLILDRNVGPIEAMQICWNELRSFAFSIFALMFVTGLLAALGVCAVCVGLLFTIPVYVITLGLTYNNFFPPVQFQSYGYQPIGVEPPR